jgi:RimJ/RimL family protein N-acetyltransferase
VLRGERGLLRPIERDDWLRLRDEVDTIEIRALADEAPPLPVSLLDFERREEEAAAARGDSAWFAVIVDEDPIGFAGLHHIDHFQQRCELGIRLGRAHWGRGFGQDALKVLLDYAFTHLAVRKVSLEVLADDPRAVGAYRKVGFVEEGRRRQHSGYSGGWHDVLVLSVLRQEWEVPENR